MRKGYLLETCLISHGLRSIQAEELRRAFAGTEHSFAWVEDGRIRTGLIEEYLPFRESGLGERRIRAGKIDEALSSGLSGALTASGTMEVCQRRGYAAAVTAGMGGFRAAAPVDTAEAGRVPAAGNAADRMRFIPADLAALAGIPVALVATSPKDMLDIERTLSWLKEHGVPVMSVDTKQSIGYIFRGTEVLFESTADAVGCGRLILNPIPDEERLSDVSILEKAVEAGITEEAKGGEFHPAVNAALDAMTNGLSSRLQLDSFLSNAQLAKMFFG